MKFDETLSSMNLSEDEQAVLHHLFIVKRQLCQIVEDTTVYADQRIWIDPVVHRGITPLDVVNFLRYNQNDYNVECADHLGSLPDELFKAANSIWLANKRKLTYKKPVSWGEEGL